MNLRRTLAATLARNPISTFAVLLVAAVGIFLAYMSWWETTILTSTDWCQKAQRAERLAPGQDPKQILEALKSCNEMLLVQLNAIATDSHIDHATFSLTLIVLIVVVIAGARASWKLGKDGFEGSVERDDPSDPPTPVVVTNPPSKPVPTAEAPKLPPMKPKP